MSIRLLDTTTMRLKVFTGDVPEYTILSHTWEPEEEIDLYEMVAIAGDPDHPAKRKLGYRKIIETCRKVNGHGFRYAWIDTCCIDKSSSAELNEAINSMYKWYEDAITCYVYLADLSPDGDQDAALRKCRWFTRGWCLQELIAPKDLRFYDAEWNFLGSKTRLKEALASITGIPDSILDGTRPLHTVPAARRMSWAANRVTTRKEDIAYCLLGILGVNMHVLYGEGDKAYVRLQEEIIRRSNDLSIFWHPKAGGLDQDAQGRILSPQFQYKDLLAQSPIEFAPCTGVAFVETGIISQLSFELTNAGLQLKQAELNVRELDQSPPEKGGRIGIYSLPLACAHSRQTGSECEIFLRKVGPGLFVRLRNWRLMNDQGPNNQVYTVTEDVCILSTIPPELRPKLDASLANAIRFRSESVRDLRHAIQAPVPLGQWDAPNVQFLTFGQSSFEGYVKVFPSLIGGPTNKMDRATDNFYIACGFKPTSPRGVWIRLFSETRWQRLEKQIGKMVGLRYIDKGGMEVLDKPETVHELVVGEVIVRAHVGEDNDRVLGAGYKVNITFPESDNYRDPEFY